MLKLMSRFQHLVRRQAYLTTLESVVLSGIAVCLVMALVMSAMKHQQQHPVQTMVTIPAISH